MDNIESTDYGKFVHILDGEGHILITDDSGNRLGYVDGKIINEIEGASYSKYRMAASRAAVNPSGNNVLFTG